MSNDTDESDTERLQIAYCFADHGAEAEALSILGNVHRFTINPMPNPYCTTTTTIDLMEEIPSIDADLFFGHPRCSDKSRLTRISGNPDDHENQIPRAREIAGEIATDYVIENVPRDDLHDAVILNGKMYGLPIHYERAFETSFPVKTPPRQSELPQKTVSSYFYSDRSRHWWHAVKGYSHDYPKEHLAKNCLPSVYVFTILRSYLEARNPRDSVEPQDNNSLPPRELPNEQSTLLQPSGGCKARSVGTGSDTE